MLGFVLWESGEGEEVALTLAGEPAPPLDIDGQPMTPVREFQAPGWDEAKQVRNHHYGWGPYTRYEG